MASDEIRLSTYGETIEIQQGLNGRVVLQVQTDDGHAAPVLTPAECDALIAAIGRALGRPAPASTPLEERIAASLRGAQQAKPFATDQWRAQGIVEVWERALAMVREQGATVPRAGVEAARERFDKWIREEGGRRNEYVEGMTVGIKDAILALDTLLAAPATQPEKG